MGGNSEVSDGICLRCKGARLLCGKTHCPILMKNSVLKSIAPDRYKKIQRDKVLFGASPPGVFVGRFGYPNVNIGPMIPINEDLVEKAVLINPNESLKDTSVLDISEFWYGKPMQEIVTYRSSLARSNFKLNVHSPSKTTRYKTLGEVEAKLSLNEQRILDASQELAMSKISVDTESTITNLKPQLTTDPHSAPLGPIFTPETIRIIDNIKVNPRVEYSVYDTDLKATDAIYEHLYKPNLKLRGEDIHSQKLVLGTEMVRLLSIGLLGTKKRRKIVPTRWAIAAVDDITSKHLAKEIKHYPEIGQYYTFQGKYLDNNFVILLLPGPWSYEMMECWAANSIWTQTIPGVQSADSFRIPKIVQDHEMETGRKNYASNITGAYYAARREIVEFLYHNHKCARAIVFREILGGYMLPLGVWVIRETVRNTLKDGFNADNMMIHSSLEDALIRVRDNFTVPLEYWMKASKFLKIIKSQRTLLDWMR
jgi:hypothetical protein